LKERGVDVDWLRLYNEIIDDPKMAKLSDKSFRIFIYLMCFAQELNENGVINRPLADISWRLRMPESQVKKAINDLISLNILTVEPCLMFLNWDKRQYKSDDRTEQSRKRRRSESTGTDIVNQSINQSVNQSVNVRRTDTDTDTDTDTEYIPAPIFPDEKPTKKTKPKKSPLPDDFKISDRVKDWAKEKGHNHLDQHLESFVGKAKAKGYEYVDWDEAFMGAIRDNWAQVKNKDETPQQARAPGKAGDDPFSVCPRCRKEVLISDLTAAGCNRCEDRSSGKKALEGIMAKIGARDDQRAEAMAAKGA
jgi:hypothetical protein